MAPSPKVAGVAYFTSGRSSKDSHVWSSKPGISEHLLLFLSGCGSCRLKIRPPPPEILWFAPKQWRVLCSTFTFCEILVQLAWIKPINCTETEILVAERCWLCVSSDWSGLLCSLGSWCNSIPRKYWENEIVSFQNCHWQRSKASATVGLSESALDVDLRLWQLYWEKLEWHSGKKKLDN